MKFSALWDSLSYAKRHALLKLAGYNKYHAARVFHYLPKAVKEDVEYAFRRSQALAS
jgi:hypothetical protein